MVAMVTLTARIESYDSRQTRITQPPSCTALLQNNFFVKPKHKPNVLSLIIVITSFILKYKHKCDAYPGMIRLKRELACNFE